jgi:A/G-specific adenine glycosylase
LPGDGRSTAAAIAAFAFGERAAILDGNVKRVLSRVFGLSDEKDLWTKTEALLPSRDIEAYTQGLMDLGATLCTRRHPACERCPVAADCVARKSDRIDELPAPRARKALPLRRATWFVYRCNGKVLLERRPSRGLWGGLWTFPETKIIDCRTTTRLSPIEHGFTHFRLRAQPVVCEVDRPLSRTNAAWISLRSAPQRAVPTPVRTLLERLQAGR